MASNVESGDGYSDILVELEEDDLGIKQILPSLRQTGEDAESAPAYPAVWIYRLSPQRPCAAP